MDFFGDFWLRDTYISRAEINWDRHGEAAYEIFSIERRFQRSKSRFSRLKGNLRMRASKSGTPVKVVILPLLASLSWKRLQIGMDMLPNTTGTVTSFSVLSTSMIVKDPELPKQGVFINFCDLRLQCTF